MDSQKNPQTYKIPENFDELCQLSRAYDKLVDRIDHIITDVCGHCAGACVESWSPNEHAGEETVVVSYTKTWHGETDWFSEEFPAKYLWMSDEDAQKDWEDREERKRQEEERKRKEAELKDTAEQFRKDYERYQELKARFECVDKSVGTADECCGTCGHKIWGAGPKDDGYLICTDKHEVRTRHSVCLDWTPEDKDEPGTEAQN